MPAVSALQPPIYFILTSQKPVFPAESLLSDGLNLMRHLIIPFFLSFPLAAHAGGDAVESQVVGISGGQGHYQFTVRTTNRTLYDDGCTTYHVRIIPPKNTFLDLFGLGGRSPDHPTEEQTKAAASVLKQHSTNHQPLKIGYLGGGLYPDPRQKCLYHGTGMWFDAPDWVWVRQDGRKGLYPHLDKP
jgi:hypothetical protein